MLFRFARIAAIVLCCGCASTSHIAVDLRHAAEQPGDVRGCLATFIPSLNEFIFEPFLKIADKESLAEDGQPEIWGFRLWNLEPPDPSGLTYPVNVPEARFIPLNIFKVVPAGRGQRTVRCPPYWSGNQLQTRP